MTSIRLKYTVDQLRTLYKRACVLRDADGYVWYPTGMAIDGGKFYRPHPNPDRGYIYSSLEDMSQREVVIVDPDAASAWR